MKRAGKKASLRNLILVLGDQLDAQSAAFDGFDRARDAVIQMEVREEAEYVPQHKLRLVFFFAAMRHFRDALRADDINVFYTAIDDAQNAGSFTAEIARRVKETEPERLVVVEPGDWRVRTALIKLCQRLDLELDIRPDRHFLCDTTEFQAYAEEHRGLLLETFYRRQRLRLNILVEDGEPTGGKWNFDQENRAKLPKNYSAPNEFRFKQDPLVRDVTKTVRKLFPTSPGSLDNVDFPVTRHQALQLLDHFVEHLLPLFGRYQDAMKAGEPILFHSRLSGPLNLHLITPREIIDRVLGAFHEEKLPLNSVEGFIRQIIGWREFMHGVYWRMMPELADMNDLGADLPVPRFMWTGETDMRCVAQSIGQLVSHSYAHHIQRLMVLGQLMLLLGVRPYDVNRWHISMFWDAIDWVSLPNTLGMSQHGDGGKIATKPYCASGRYIDRMSDYCGKCRYDPAKAGGEDACPFTTLYWDFLARHQKRFAANRRMGFQYQNLARKDTMEITAIRRHADTLKARFTAETFL